MNSSFDVVAQISEGFLDSLGLVDGGSADRGEGEPLNPRFDRGENLIYQTQIIKVPIFVPVINKDTTR